MNTTDLNKYTRNELLQITENVAKGLSIEEAIKSIVPEEGLKVAREIHALICHKRHNQEPDSCTFYSNTGEDYTRWIGHALKLIEACPSGDVYNAISCLKHIANEAVEIERKGGEPAIALLLLLINQYFKDIKPMEW